MNAGLIARTCLLAGLLSIGTSTTSADTPGPESPYAGEEQRQIKSLSETNIAALRNGAGMGYAKAAELNGWPGPKHVLDLAEDLHLSKEQMNATRNIFSKMQAEAIRLGEELLQEEARLEAMFARGEPQADDVVKITLRIGEIDGRLRAIHLNAHLEQRALLDQQQVHRYVQLRGYGDGKHSANHQH